MANMIDRSKSKAVFGIYEHRAAAEGAVAALKKVGFPINDGSVLLPEEPGSQDIAHFKSSKSPEGAASGASAGAVLGGALGLLAGVGALAIPGAGPLIAAGPLMSTLAGLGVGGLVGGVSGALIGLGLPEYEAKRFEGSLKKGGILLSVHADTTEEVASARQVLKITGAKDIATTYEKTWKTPPPRKDVGGPIPPSKSM